MAVIFFNGVWYLVINWLALNHQEFPKRLAYLGIALGVVSLIPILGALVLLLSIPWYLGLRRVMINWNNADSVHTPN